MRKDRAFKILAVAGTAYRPRADAGSYMVLASQIAHSGDYANRYWPGSGAGGSRGPTAYFAPGFPYFLAAVDLIDGHTEKKGPPLHGARISQALLGTVTVALVGVVAWEAFGTAIAVVALALAALYPVLIELFSPPSRPRSGSGPRGTRTCGRPPRACSRAWRPSRM